VTVGLRCTARALEAPRAGGDGDGGRPGRLLAVLRAGGGGGGAPLCARLPALAPPRVRLIALRSVGAERRLAVALGVPRVGVLGLAEGLLGVEALLQ
jgi:hypothetical protein